MSKKFSWFPVVSAAALAWSPVLLSGQQVATAVLPDAPSVLVSSSLGDVAAQAPQTPQSATQPAPQPQGQQPGTAAQQGQAPNGAPSSADQLKAEEKQRLLGIMPAFNSVESGSAAPLRPSQKFDLWYHSAVDPFTFAVAGIDAGIEQAQNTYPEYHQGFEGFAKRFGAAYADNVDGNFWGNAVLPSLLHQDPRYFRLGYGSKKGRLWYAVISTVRCKGDNGKWEPSYSNVGGNLIGGAISNVYYPAADRGVGLTISRGLTVTAEGALGAIAYEFYPDVVQHFIRRHHADAGPTVPPAGSSGPAASTGPAATTSPRI